MTPSVLGGGPAKTQAWVRDGLLLPPGGLVSAEATWSLPVLKLVLGFLPVRVVITDQCCPKRVDGGRKAGPSPGNIPSPTVAVPGPDTQKNRSCQRL